MMLMVAYRGIVDGFAVNVEVMGKKTTAMALQLMMFIIHGLTKSAATVTENVQRWYSSTSRVTSAVSHCQSVPDAVTFEHPRRHASNIRRCVDQKKKT